MKQRKIYIEVQKLGENVIFSKDNCTPQDIISALSLFGNDGIRFYITVDDVELSPCEQQN